MDEIKDWLEEIQASKKREDDFRKNGEAILKIYGAEDNSPFNILYSNTETLLPALFSQLPRPVITRRFKDEDPLGKAAAEVGQRMLEYLIDTDIDEYEPFEGAVCNAVADGLLPGRGVTSIKYEADVIDPEEGEGIPYKEWETVCCDSRKWDRVYFGYAHKWSKMPWIAYEEFLDKAECEKLFKDKANKIKFTEGEEDENHKERDKTKTGKRKTAQIYQIWDKSDKKVKWICPQVKDDYLRVDDDPLELNGFYNIPKPIQFLYKSHDLIPVALYTLYENQAKELNRVQKRLNKVVEAIKVRGAYNGNLGEELEKVFKEDDNAMIPTDKTATLIEGGFDKNIWMIPITELVAVAQQLYQARESCKSVIYEITGISDIVRGQSMASETLGAQKIKETWGTMRLKRLQKEVQRYVLDMMKIMLEIAVSKFSIESWKKMTMLPYPMLAEKQQAIAKVQQYQSQMQANQQAAQSQGVPPTQMPPLPPQLMQMAQSPAWEEIMEILKDDFTRSYRLDIETNSTLDVEATEDKQLVGDFMNAMAQLMNGMAPMLQNGMMPFPAFKAMMLSIVQRYRFGREVEDQLKQMKAPQMTDPKQVQEMQKKLGQEKQKFDQEKQKVEKVIEEKGRDLEARETQFDFEKKLAALQQKHKDDMSKARSQMRDEQLESSLQKMLIKHESKVQKIVDRAQSNMEKKVADLRVSVPERP